MAHSLSQAIQCLSLSPARLGLFALSGQPGLFCYLTVWLKYAGYPTEQTKFALQPTGCLALLISRLISRLYSVIRPNSRSVSPKHY